MAQENRERKKKLAFNRIATNLLSNLCVTLKKSKTKQVRKKKHKHIFSSLITSTMDITLNVNGHGGHKKEKKIKIKSGYAQNIGQEALTNMECLPFCDKIHLVTDEMKSLAFRSMMACAVFFPMLFDNARLLVGHHTSINKF